MVTSAPVGEQRGLLNDDNEVSFPGARVTRWMNTLWCSSFGLSINVRSLTSTIVKGPIVFLVCSLYVVVPILSDSLADSAADDSL